MKSGQLLDVWRDSTFKFIFIDGDHSLEGVRIDTEVAVRLLAPGGIIAWHDCLDGAPDWVGVKRYLTGLSMELDLVQVEGTWLALYLNGHPL